MRICVSGGEERVCKKRRQQRAGAGAQAGARRAAVRLRRRVLCLRLGPLVCSRCSARHTCHWRARGMATVLPTSEPIPPELHNLEKSGWHLEVWKSTYEANDPSEDRSTVVIDPENFVFAGVWDGHGRLPPLAARLRALLRINPSPNLPGRRRYKGVRLCGGTHLAKL